MTQHLISPPVMNISGVAGLDTCWALDRFSHPLLGLTRAGLLLGRAKVGGLGPACAELAERMGDVASRQLLPDDLVVAAVPSASTLSQQMAVCVAAAIERPLEPLLGVRGGVFGRLDGSVRGRIKAKVRTAPAHVLLIDDSVRSGDTLKACAAMLRQRGSAHVWAVVAVAILDAGDRDPTASW